MPEGMATKKPAVQVETCGVRKRAWTREKRRGSRPSRDIANHTRACPSWKTKSELSMPINAPTVTQR